MSGDKNPAQAFIPLDSPIEIRKLLKEGAGSAASVILWTNEQKQLFRSHLSAYTDVENCFYIWIPADLDINGFLQEMQSQRHAECYLNILLKRTNLFFKSRLVGSEMLGLKFLIPNQIFKLQRRRNFRLPIPDGYVMKVEFSHPFFPENRLIKKIHDISASGLSFLIEDHEEVLFQAGLLIKEIQFMVKNRKITTDAEIRHINSFSDPVRPKKILYQVGLALKNMKPSDSDHIAAYVLEESRKFWVGPAI